MSFVSRQVGLLAGLFVLVSCTCAHAQAQQTPTPQESVQRESASQDQIEAQQAVPAEGAAEETSNGHEAAVEHSGEHADEHGLHGAYSLWGDLPFWSLIAFIGFVWAIKKLGLWNLLTTSMASREAAELEAIRIAEQALSDAQASLREAQGQLEAIDEQVREILAEADRDAAYTRDEIARLAEVDARAAVARAEHDIERVKNQSLHQIFESSAEKVAAATEARLKAGLQDHDQDRLIQNTLSELAIR